MKLELVIDARERDLIQQLQKENIQYSVKVLELGDILIRDDENVLSIFERKTFDDLYASIKDGRYHNQKKRLMKSFDIKKIGYIIEGHGSFLEEFDTQRKILLSCFYNMTFRDQLKVFRTSDISDTVHFIKGIWSRYQSDPEKYKIGGDGGGHGEEEQIVKLGTVNSASDYFIRALCQLPGVSLKTAKVIGEKYKTLMDLVRSLDHLSSDEKLAILKEIKIPSPSGSRKISGTVARNIVYYMLT